MVEESSQPLLTPSQETELFKELEIENLSPSTILNFLPEYSHSSEPIYGVNVNHQEHFQGSLQGLVGGKFINENIEGQHQIDDYSNSLESSTTTTTQVLMQAPLVPPPPTSSIISNEDYPGPLNFEVFIDPHLVPGNKAWVYSDKLKKVFIGMGHYFPVDFRCNSGNNLPLFVRAIPLYSLSQHAQERVVRCIAHAQKSDGSNQGFPEHVWSHVIRCHNPDTVYQGNNDRKERLSVVVPLEKPQTGSDTVRIMYQFVCKNSCPSGMNRKPLEVVFTLEDHQGNVLGRTKVNIRVCSSPKRDREKEEKESLKRLANGEIPSSKKRKENQKKVEADIDFKTHEITIPVVGSHNVNHVLKYAFDAMAGDQKRFNIEQPFQDAMNKISSMLGKQQ